MRYTTSVLASAALLLAPAALAPSDGASGDWLARAQRSLERREYQASRSRSGLQAPNRVQNLRTYFDATGIRVHDRTADTELLSLALSGIGRGDVLAPLAPGEVTSVGARVEIRRGGVVEWYENSAAGLEQGFTLAERPAGEGPLLVELALEGATARLRDDAVIFSATSGRRLRYGQLVAIDAAGTQLAARLTVSGPRRVGIEVDDAGAVYPVIIDPLLWGTADGVIEADQVYAPFESLAGAGDVNGDGYDDVIVGAPFYDVGGVEGGAAFLFLGGETGIEDAIVSAADAILHPDRSDAGFGISVAGTGDVNGDGYDDVIVGASGFEIFDNDGFAYRGAAFLFLGSASGIESGVPSAAVTRIVSDQPSDPYPGRASGFGTSVAGAGDVNGDGFADVVVGAPYNSQGQQASGAVYVFLGSATGIVATDSSMAAAKLESASPDSWLGWSEAGAGDLNADGYDDLIVGARSYEFQSSFDTGSAFVFMGSASGIAAGDTSTAAARLEPDQQGVEFGHDVAGAGDVNQDGYDDVIVGSDRYNGGQGAAFVFLGSASGIADSGPETAATRIDAAGGAAGAGDVNGDGYDDVLVGGLVFLGGASGVADGNPDTAVPSPQSFPNLAHFGEKVAGIGDVNGDGYADVIVGAAFFAGHGSNRGGAFIYLGQAFADPNGEPELADARIASDRKGAQLGIDVSGAGDVNADGYHDVIVRVPQYDRGNGYGANFVFMGSASGLANTEALATAIRIDAGGAATRAGDVNGDGYDDVMVTFGYGDVLFYLGSAAGIADGSVGAAATRLSSDQTGGFSGESLAAAGDVNGDGFDDVIVGGQSADPASQTYPGAAYVFLGSAYGIADAGPAAAATRLVSDQRDSWFGQSVAGAGDVNGDGYDDVIVGATNYQVPGPYDPYSGAAFVFLGSASGIPNGGPGSAATWLQWDSSDSGFFGESVAGAGDVNADGYGDVIVGASGWCCGGAAFVFLGSSAGIPDGAPDSAATLLSVSPFDPEWGQYFGSKAASEFGAAVAGAGDVNGDGYDDVVVGAPSSYAGQNREGAAFVFLGSASGIANAGPGAAAGQLESNRRYAELGRSIAGAGDVNGDGFDDVIVGAPGYYPGGAAFVFLGEADGDFLGAPNSLDNCTSRTNPLQLDRDGDGFGNHCDADFDQDGVAGGADFGTFRRCFGQPVPSSDGPTADPTCAESDMDGNGVVGGADFVLFRSEFGTPAGP